MSNIYLLPDSCAKLQHKNRLAATKELYKGENGYNSEEDFAEEVIADTVGQLLYDGDMTRKIAYRLEHPVLGALRQAAERVKNYFTGGYWSDVVLDFQSDIFKAMKDAQNGVELKEGEESTEAKLSIRLTDKEKDDATKRIDERIAELNRLNENQSLKSNIGNSAESHSDDGYLPDNKTFAGVQSADSRNAKVNKKFPNKEEYISKLASFIDKLPSNNEITSENFVKSLYSNLGLTPHSREKQISEYVRYTADGGEKVTIRLSDHSGNAISIIKKGGRADRGYSIVIKVPGSPDTKFKSNRYSNVTEFVYDNPDKSRLTDIAKSIFDLVDSGTYTDIANADYINFSPKSDDKQEIIRHAKESDTYMKTPNGEVSDLTPEQWADVRTDNFKEFFGDWENDPENASKVVDENGEPQVMYHDCFPFQPDKVGYRE